jgi:hypothetical protein
MPDNRTMAEQRLKSLSKRLSKDLELKGRYSEVLNGYITKGHARKLTEEEVNSRSSKTWYLPHHCVLNPRKPNKVRVVFDAAAELNGVSLNKSLITGPDLLNSIFGVIQRFRMKPIAVVADVVEMFHQVRVPEEDSDALRFLWRTDLDDTKPPEVFKMLVHIFGATDSPCCANYALQQVAQIAEIVDDKDTKQAILRNFYMDDMLLACDDVSSAIRITSTLSAGFASMGFQLAKWMSSSSEVMQHFAHESMSTQHISLDFNDLPLERVLGIGWNIKTDGFVFNPVLRNVSATKRNVISVVSSIFDPCGFLAPFVFKAKLLIQEIWTRNLGWDDNLPEDLLLRWQEWQADVQHLSQLFIPRYIKSLADKHHLELHLFSDASEAGFASVAYLRMVKDDGSASCSFIAAKTHVAPRKQVLTIPKLELQGAVMSVRLANAIRAELDNEIDKVLLWTDSLTVLRYISNDARRWKIFVANRVTEIRESTEPDQWRYVPSEQNPADLASRGCSSRCMLTDSKWYPGPQFLQKDEVQWPSSPELSGVPLDDENLRRAAVSNIVSLEQSTDATSRFPNCLDVGKLVDIQKFSSWHHLKKHTAWILRALRNFLALRQGSTLKAVKSSHLQCEELQEAEMCLIRLSQQECFPDDLACLRDGKELDYKSSLKSLDPIMDQVCEVIRVGGRLRKAPDWFEYRQPILLPYDNHITWLILEDIHTISSLKLTAASCMLFRDKVH